MVKRYLNLVSCKSALETIRTEFPPKLLQEKISLEHTSGRITAEPIFAHYSVPPIHLAAMDGIAVCSRDTIGASEQNPVVLPSAFRINTGNIVPREFDAVIMIEDVWIDGESYTIRKAAAPWQHIRPAGEDIAESEMILPSMHRIRPHEIGALATYGVSEVSVLCCRIGLIPTGSELIPHGVTPGPGQVVESNTLMAAAYLESLGAACRRYPITPDEPDLIRRQICEAMDDNDVVIVSAGSSAGTRDYTAGIIDELGKVLVHGVAIKPGKPVIIGKVDDKPIIGMPGYPLGAITILREIVTPLLTGYGLSRPNPESLPARLTTTLHSDVGTDEFVLLSVGKIGDSWIASPQSRGSGIQMSAVRANAYLKIPAHIEGFESGSDVPVHLMVPRSQAESALIITGSHDPAMDYIADLVQKRGVELHSTHVGSMGGLIALRKNDCHGAPMHLLSPDGSYNIEYLRKYLPDDELVLLCIAEREQGIASRDGIGLEGITGGRFINRQRGSGTRILLDHELERQGIRAEDIDGYNSEATTHLAVALAVSTGEADAGMCVYSAARAMGLSFVPVARERYELVFRQEQIEDPRVAALFETVDSDEFRQVLKDLGGYDISRTGEQRRLP